MGRLRDELVVPVVAEVAEVVRTLAGVIGRQESNGVRNVDQPVALAEDHVVVAGKNVRLGCGVFLGLDAHRDTDVLQVVLDDRSDVRELCPLHDGDDFQGAVRGVPGVRQELPGFLHVLLGRTCLG